MPDRDNPRKIKRTDRTTIEMNTMVDATDLDQDARRRLVSVADELERTFMQIVEMERHTE